METKKYNLEERTRRYGENIILLCNKVKRSPISNPLITQLVKSGTSVGANYCEADNAESKQDFRHKIGICKKEAKESEHFLQMLIVASPEIKIEAILLSKEARELTLIFNSIYIKVSK